MTPARSLAASVIALGFASSLTAPLPAYAAPVPCEEAQNYAAQSGAEMLRIDRLAWRTGADHERPSIKSSPSSATDNPPPPNRPSRDTESVTDAADGLLGPDADLTGGDSGQGVTGFLSGTGDLLESINNGAVTGPGGPVKSASGRLLSSGSGGQGGGGPVSSGRAGQSGGRPHSATSGDGSAITDLDLGEAKTAMIADARTNAVAVGRMADAKGALGKILVKAAPPNSADASHHTPSGSAGPLGLGAGDLGTHAAWDPAMACGKAFGEAARSTASLDHFALVDGDLIRSPGTIVSQSWTSLARSGGEARSVATATMTAGGLTLADGRIKVRVLHPPALTASMGTGSGGSVVYKPAQVQVTWPGGSKVLNIAGDSVDVSLDNGHSSESTPIETLPNVDGLLPASPLPLPAIPGLPSIATPDTESAPALADGVTARISLGQAHQATKGHAIAAKVPAIQIAIASGRTERPYGNKNGRDKNDRHKDGYDDVRSAIIARMSLGLLEAAAVSPEAMPDNSGTAGAAALPITGSPASLFAVGGIALLVVGAGALLIGRRRRRTLP